MIFIPFKYGSKAFAIKCALTGNKGGDNAVNYVMSNYDHKGDVRSVMPLVLKGNPELMKAHLSNNNFSNQYLSCVLTFNEGDIDMETIRYVADDFVRMIFPGLREDQFSQLQVLHKDKDKTEIHFIFGKQELSTGKFINPYISKRDFGKIDSWQNAINAELNLHDPKDPRNRRLSQENQKDLPKSADEVKSLINTELEILFEEGLIKNRQDLITQLQAMEGIKEVSRITKRNISVIAEGHNKPIRLKGAMFEESFDFNSFSADHIKSLGEAWDADREARAKRERAKAEREYEKQAEYNRRYYRASDKQVLEASLYALVDDNIIEGNIGSRKDIVELIKKQDKVVDVVDTHKHHISIYYEGGARPFRMTGEAFKREGDIMKYLETLLENKEMSDLDLQERRRQEEEYYFSNREGNNIDFVRMKDSRWNDFAEKLQNNEEVKLTFNENYGIIDNEIKTVFDNTESHTLFDLSIFEVFERENRQDIERHKRENKIENKESYDGTARRAETREVIESDTDRLRDRRLIEEINRQSREKPKYLQQYISRTVEALKERFGGDEGDSIYGSGNYERFTRTGKSFRASIRDYQELFEGFAREGENFKAERRVLEEEGRGFESEERSYTETAENIIRESDSLISSTGILRELTRRSDERKLRFTEESSGIRRSSRTDIRSSYKKQIEIFKAKYGYISKAPSISKEKVQENRDRWIKEVKKVKLKNLDFNMK